MATNTRGPIGAKPRTNGTSTNQPKIKKKFAWKAADRSWHKEIQGLYNSLKNSTNFEDFEESDMWLARLLCSELSDLKYNPEKNASHFKTQMTLFLEFAPTLASRRRLSLEVEKAVDDKKHAELMENMALSILTGQKMKPSGDTE